MGDRAVVMTVSGDRPSYLRETLESWDRVRGLESWTVGFAVEPGAHHVLCHRYIAEWMENREGFVLRNAIRKGVLGNPHFLLDYAFHSFPFVVLAEEDVLVADDVLGFFARADEEFALSDVLTVCASTMDPPGGDPAGWQKTQTFSPLVWGTWRGRWDRLLRDTWDLDYSTGLPDGSQAGWDWNINRILKTYSMTSVSPLVSRSLHIGKHGVHMLEEDFKKSQAPSFVPSHSENHWKIPHAV